MINYFILCSIFFSLSISGESHFSLTVLHTNDIHSRIEEIDEYGSMCKQTDRKQGKCYGGIARIATKLKEIRRSVPNVNSLDAGDQQTGTLWYDVFEGNATAYFINKLRYDAMVLGNHDFDGGVQHTIKYLEKMNASVVMSNVDVTRETAWPKRKLFESSLVIKVGSKQLGICGYLLKTTPRYSKPGPNIKFNDEVTSVRECAKNMRRNGINIVLALGHAGIEMDRKIAKEVDDIDIVIGGHTNTFLYSGTPPSNDVPYGPYPLTVTRNNGKKCLVVQAFAYGKYLGRLNVNFSVNGDIVSWSGNPILLDQRIAKDPGIVKDIITMKGSLDKVGKVRIGQTLVHLDGERTSCRLGECVLGNLVTDAAVYSVALASKTMNAWTTASIALWTSNSIMASIDANRTGYIYFEDVKNSFPYTNTIDIVDLRGDVLLDVLEKSASFYNREKPSGSFLQMSGVHATFDVSKAINNRVKEIQVRCANCTIPTYEKLDKNRLYKVIISSYMATGGAGYDMLRTRRSGHQPGSVKDTTAIMNYIRSKTPVLIETGNRLHVILKSSNVSSFAIIYHLSYFVKLACLIISIYFVNF